MSSINRLNLMCSEDRKPWDTLKPANELTLFHFTSGQNRRTSNNLK
ncbi:MAG: hypothetical protein AWU59_1962 [Methanolobus sp. T82-4]|nr:MAG: hypothetical protein AWU59_1962 [Methanolobus sp. T82-4]